jgi:hypothetical protein
LEWRGSGQDEGEKGLYQAYTGGLKYFLLDLFLLPTFDDPEKRAEKPEPARVEPLQAVPNTLGDIERTALIAALDAHGVAEGDQNVVFEWSAQLTFTDYTNWLGLLTDGKSAEIAAATIVKAAVEWQTERAAAA